MQTEAKVARGAAALYVASIFSLLLNTAYFVILTNFISVDEVGLVSLLNVLVIGTSTLATLALPLVGSGITATPPAVTRFLSQYIQTGEGSARKLYFLSAGICAAASSAAAVLLSNPSIAASLAAPLSPKPFVYASLDAVAYSFSQLGIYSLVGGGRAPLAGKLLIASSALRYAVASLLLFLGYAVSGVFIGFSIGDFFLAAISTSLAAKMVFASKEAPFRVRPVAAYMVSVMVAAFAGFGVTQVDKLLAFFQQGLGNLGVYNVATVGAAIASFAPSAVTNVLVPTLGSLRPGEGGRRRELMRNYTRYIIFIAAPMGAGLAAVSPFL
ncbi:MAG TPA: oligosaccharide flippase family protein, partial [Nitrososphaerales archaeon]|nr:oligosaccharide flippase family protein [Nitrososphaerales archaeon]